MRTLILLSITLSGCYVGPVFKLHNESKRSCASPMVELTGDLAIKVDSGAGDGVFDYDLLSWPLVAHTSGDYDLKTGSFTFTNQFAESAVRVSELATGAGVIRRNGDLDLHYTQTVSFIDGSQNEFDVRHVRTGCVATLRTEALGEEAEGDVVLTDVTWENGGRSWVRNFVEGPAPVQGIGRMEADRSWSETVDFAQGGLQTLWLTEGDGNGHQTRTFDDDNGFDKKVGMWERFYDGTVMMDFTRNNPNTDKQTWQFSVDALGQGSGTYETKGLTCDINFKEGQCRLKSCTNEDWNGKCEVPVTWPRF